MDKYCANCQRVVGTKKNTTPGIVLLVIGIILFLFVPIFGLFIGAPMAFIGLLLLIFSGSRCPICNGKNLSNPPAPGSQKPETSHTN